MKDYGGALKKLRKHFGFTQKLLAEKLNVSYQTVSKWETGTNQMDLDTVRVMCDVLGISLDAFIKVADGAAITDVLSPAPATDAPAPITEPAPAAQPVIEQPAPVTQPTQTELADTAPEPVAAPVQPAMPTEPASTQPLQSVQPAQPAAAPQPKKDSNAAARKPIDKVALVLALVLLAVIVVFIIATCVVFAPSPSSGFGDLLGAQKGPSITVSFDLNGSSGSSMEDEEYKGVVELPDCDEYTGYKFVGWTYNGKVYKAGAKLSGIKSSHITVTANWKPITYTIKFVDRNGNSSIPSITAEYDKSVYLPKSTYKYNGKEMLYWKCAQNGNRYDDRQTVKNLTHLDGVTVTLQACWDSVYFNLQLDGNGGSGGYSNVGFYSDSPKTVSEFGWSMLGYELVGWKYGNKTYRVWETFKDLPYSTSNHSLQAVWQPARYQLWYKCNMDGCEGTGDNYDVYRYGSDYVLREPCAGKHEGYELAGIYADEYNHPLQQPGETPEIFSYTSTSMRPKQIYKPIECKVVIKCETNSGVKLYDDLYTWQYNTDLLEGIKRYIEYDWTVGKKTGYHKTGCKVYVNGSEYTGDMSKVTTDKSDEIVVEILQEINTYTLKFPLDDGNKSVELEYDEEYTLTETVSSKNEGYIFDGWRINYKNYKSSEKVSKLTQQNEETLTASPIFNAITYTVQLDADGGDGVTEPLTLGYNQYSKLPDCGFTKDGHDFIAWERDGERYYVGQTLYNLSKEQDDVITFKAVWAAKYEGNGMSQSPYLISTYEQLYNLHWYCAVGDNANKYYALTSDIDCDGNPLYPICGAYNTYSNGLSPFTGSLSGNYHVIKNADFKAQECGSSIYAGLFGQINGAKIRDLGIEGYSIGVELNGKTIFAAPLAAAVYSSTSITHVWTNGAITIDKDRKGYYAGFIGDLVGGTVEDCFSTGKINMTCVETEGSTVGGFAARAGRTQSMGLSTPVISRCYADMNITATAEQNESGKGYVSGFIYTIYGATVNSSFVSGSATLCSGCIARKVGEISSAKNFTTDGKLYVRSDYTMTVGGEVYYGEGDYDNTPAQNLCSEEWLTTELKFNMALTWQITENGLPTLRGFAGGDE